MRLKPLAAAFLAAALVLPLRPALPDNGDDAVVCIASFEDLVAFSERIAHGETVSARLTADITATRPLRAIGTAVHMFSGEFDGQGHVISRLVVMGPSGGQGLFGWIAPEGVVRNVTLERAYVAGASWVGGVAGYCAGRIERCRTEACRVVNLSRARFGVAAGGIAGLASGCIANCAALGGSISGPANVGGLCGAFHAGVVERCAFSGTVIDAGSYGGSAGALAGALHGGARLRFCAGCGLFPAGGAAGGVYSGSSVVGCVVGGPGGRDAARLTEALGGRAGLETPTLD